MYKTMSNLVTKVNKYDTPNMAHVPKHVKQKQA